MHGAHCEQPQTGTGARPAPPGGFARLETEAADTWPDDTADGFASVNTLGQDGTFNDLRHMADGLIDSRKDTTSVRVSWNKFSNNKTFGIGWTENTTVDLTIHHNWLRETEQRNPSADNLAHAPGGNRAFQRRRRMAGRPHDRGAVPPCGRGRPQLRGDVGRHHP